MLTRLTRPTARQFCAHSAFKRYAHHRVYFESGRNNRYGYSNGNRGNYWSWLNWSTKSPAQKKTIYVSGGVLSLIILTHIEEAPVTKRHRLMLAPNWVEAIVTEQSFQSVMGEYSRYILPQSHPLTRQVRSIMTRLITAAHDYRDPDTGAHEDLFKLSGKPDIPLDQWEIYVIDDVSMGKPTPNAFVIGGGKVFLFRSILQICQDDVGLGTVLSHELGHLLASHINEKLSTSPFFFTLDILMLLTFGTTTPGNFVSTLLSNSYSREMETEADYIGLMVQSRACINPSGAPQLWKNMIKFERTQGQNVPELLSTHPSSDRRFRNLNEWMPKAMRIYELNECGMMNSFKGFFR